MADTITETTGGTVQGREKDGIVLFAGIPYAASPTGDRRFRPPEPRDPWTGTLDARRFGKVSWQSPRGLGGLLSGPPPDCDEDCLTLNVVTPAVDDGARPVMVWIHGGAFIGGSGSTPWYNGTSFASRGDVVVVTLNYRLGALGFLHLGEVGGEAYASSGLSGILDQAAALQWVRDNIANFGGDPGNVTVFGESAGGMSVGTLLGLPEASGLFHRAIAQSGASSNLIDAGDASLVTKAFLSVLGTDDMGGLLDASPEQILDAQTKVGEEIAAHPERYGTSARRATGLPFQPVIDGIRLPRSPLDAVADGAARVPLLVGTNADEWNLFALMNPGPTDDDGIIRAVDRLGASGAEALATYRRARPAASPAELWSAIMTDSVFRMPAIRLLEAQAANRPDDTFAYWFTWATPAFDGRLGSCHALEIPFVFNTLTSPGADLLLAGDPPESLALAMQDAWIAFARTGNPSHDGIGEWPAYDATRRATMEFSTQVGIVDDPGADERSLWAARS
jgi:para-nitrobenzyl esterase